MAEATTTKAPKENAAERSRRQPRPTAAAEAGAYSAILGLQEAVGNRMVAQLLQPGDDLATSEMSTPPTVAGVGLDQQGQPMVPSLRAFMESRFGEDFSQVRLHTDGQAARSARAAGADAYTVEHDVVFAEGRYEPDTSRGKALLAHELTHVVQQTRAAGTAPSSAESEREAAATGGRAITGQPIAIHTSAAIGMQCQTATSSTQWKDLLEISDYMKEEHRPISRAYGGMETGMGNKSFDDMIGEVELKPSSEVEIEVTNKKGKKSKKRGHKKVGISEETLLKVAPKLKEVGEKKIRQYVANLNEAFAIFGIDTLESQALFLTHAIVESKQFSHFTEAQKQGQVFLDKPAGPRELYLGDPARGKCNIGVDIHCGLENLYPEFKPGTQTRNPIRQGLDPISRQWDFIGRSALQVTFGSNYLQALAVMQRRSEDLRREAFFEQDNQTASSALLEQSEKLSKVVRAILKDPHQAANPEFAFLFSAAYAKRPWGEKGYAYNPAPFDRDAFNPQLRNAPWMTGSNPDPKGSKKAAEYNRVLEILKREMEAANASQNVAPGATPAKTP